MMSGGEANSIEASNSEGYVADIKSCCASCGIAEIDDVKLKECDGCDLVKYCSDECQRDHKSEHDEACKKRAAELRDELLFRQPESTHMGDCPICSLPLPLEIEKAVAMTCCSKIVCRGCDVANKIRENEMRLGRSCPFCREPVPKTDEGLRKQRMKRVEVNDPVALCQEGAEQGCKGEYIMAFDYLTKAAELGDAEAHCRLHIMYHCGLGVEKDKGKEIYHLEEAAIGGHIFARFSLGQEEEVFKGNHERAVKHWIIAATQGCDKSIKALIDAFKSGFIKKDGLEDLEATLRAHKAAVDATKSPQRTAAEKYYR